MTEILAKYPIDRPEDSLWPYVANKLAQECRENGAKGIIYFGMAEIDGQMYAIAKGYAE